MGPLLVCQRCGHREDVHPGHGPCRFHLCDCPVFLASRVLARRVERLP